MFDFSWALKELRSGKRLKRARWDSKVFVMYQEGYPEGVPMNENMAKATGQQLGTKCYILPYLMIRTKTGKFAPWTPDQAELIADDWEYAE